MRFLPTILILITIFLQSCTSTPAVPAPTPVPFERAEKKHDLVLIHGLANIHKWSDSFLELCLKIWESGHFFIVYSSAETGVITRTMNGKVLIIGGNGDKAGINPINTQVTNVTGVIQRLQDKYGLHPPFSIIAHSMGGLVARQYTYNNPDKVTGLVTLGTPHHGSPLAESFQWIGLFLNAAEAIKDLRPKNIDLFNNKYPAGSTPLTYTKKICLFRRICG